ncbi:DUF5320 domain-containing protein [Nanoarchaeota archaeon]
MPGYDRKGPRGEGPLTGKGFGACGGNKPMIGFCRRHMNRFRSGLRQTSKEEEKAVLENELKEMDAERQEIEKRLKEIQNS